MTDLQEATKMPEIRVTRGSPTTKGRSRTPGPRTRISGQKHRRSQSSKSSITTQGSPAKRPMSKKIVPEDFPAPARTPPAQFDAYLRVQDSWQPIPSMSPGAGQGHQYIALRKGDVILQHARYPSGWSYGQTLTTGTYGFLPANHCISFHPLEVRELLDALLNVWTSFGAHREDAIASHMIQDNVSAMLGGVRLFLKRMQCLEGDAALVKSHSGIWKMRKSLLGDFHVFVKASKMLQELHQTQTDNIDDRQFVLVKACKVAMRAVKFLDMWNALMDEKIEVDGDLHMQFSNPGTPSSLPTALPTSLDTYKEYPFPVVQADQSTVHPALRLSDAGQDEEAQDERLPQTTYSSSSSSQTPTKGATTRMSGLQIGSNQSHNRTISRDLPGLISASTSKLVPIHTQSQSHAGTQRSRMNASNPTTSADFAARGSSLPTNARATRTRTRQGSEAAQTGAGQPTRLTSPIAPESLAPASTSHTVNDPVRAIDGCSPNFSAETTPTRAKPQPQHPRPAPAQFRAISAPLAPRSLNVPRLPAPSDSVKLDEQSTAAAATGVATDASVLASHKLAAAHDAFLGLLGVYIGGHLKRRSTMDLYRTTHETSVSCQILLDVVLEIWQRDGQQSNDIDEAAQAMRTQFAELYDVTSEILKSSAEAESDADAVLAIPSHDSILAEVATNCARSAGDCVVKTRAVLERLGDFDFSSARIAETTTTDEQSASGAQANSKSNDDADDVQSKTSLDSACHSQSSYSHDNSSSTSPSSSSTSPQSLLARPPTHAPPPPPPPPPPVARVTTPFTSSLLSSSSTSSQTTPTPTPGAGYDSHGSKYMPAPIRTDLGLKPSIDVEIPGPLSPFDFEQARISFSSVQSKTKRADSVGASVTNSTSTRISSFRHSGTSILSNASTRATTPDRQPRKDLPERALNESFGTLTSESVPLTPEDDASIEAHLFSEAHAHELVLNNESQIVGGTLPALVEKLTPYDCHPDSVFLNAFFLTFRLFTTPPDFAQALVDRFDGLAIHHPAHTKPVRLRVYNIFKSWLEQHWIVDSDDAALPIIKQFAQGPLHEWLSTPSQRLFQLVEKKENMDDDVQGKRAASGLRRANTAASPVDGEAPTPQISKAQLSSLRKAQEGGPACNILLFEPLEIARQLTIIESRLFCKIQPEELLGQAWNKKDHSKSVNVRGMSSLTNDIANLVADTILSFEEPKKRALAIKQWITIARHCQDFGNYNIIFAIMGSLNTSMIHRLEKTWSFVSPKTRAVFQELQQLTEFRRNYAELRKRLSNHLTPSPCVPFVGMYLTDLTFVDVGNGSVRQVRHSSVANGAESTVDLANPSTRPVSLSAANSSGGIHHNEFAAAGEAVTSVINFDKYAKTARIISDLQRFQVEYDFQVVPELMEWLEKQLSRVRTQKEELMVTHDRRSKQLEPKRAETRKDDKEKDMTKNDGLEEAAAAINGTTNGGSGRGRLQWMGKLNFGAHRDKERSTS